MIHDYRSNYLNFINKLNLKKYCDIYKKKKLTIKDVESR